MKIPFLNTIKELFAEDLTPDLATELALVCAERDRLKVYCDQTNKDYRELAGEHDALRTRLDTFRTNSGSQEVAALEQQMEIINERDLAIKKLQSQFDEYKAIHEARFYDLQYANERRLTRLNFVERQVGELQEEKSALKATTERQFKQLLEREKLVTELQAALVAADVKSKNRVKASIKRPKITTTKKVIRRAK